MEVFCFLILGNIQGILATHGLDISCWEKLGKLKKFLYTSKNANETYRSNINKLLCLCIDTKVALIKVEAKLVVVK